MAYQQPGGMNLESSLKRAIEAYEASWKVVDPELYDLEPKAAATSREFTRSCPAS